MAKLPTSLKGLRNRLSKYKYAHFTYIDNDGIERNKTYFTKDLDIELCTTFFRIYLYSIKFSRIVEPITNITNIFLSNNINENIADFLENYLCINIIFMIIKYIIFIFMILTVILAFSIFVKVIIEHEKDSDELADIKDNFSKIITEGANTACINKLCKKLQSISDEDIYMVLKSFKTPYLLGLKNILQQDKERKKNKVPKVLKSTTIFSAIGTLLKYLKDELHFNFIVLIDLIDSQKDNITIFISMIILFVCLILLDPYLSTNKERRIISSNYLILLIDDILEIKKSEEILSVKIIEKRGKRVRRPVRLGRK